MSGLAGRSLPRQGRSEGPAKLWTNGDTDGVEDVRTKWRDEEGAAAVEFAIIMTLLFTILFGIVELGITLSKYQSFLGAAREGARYAAVRCAPDSSTVCDDTLIANRVTLTAGYPIGPGSPTEDIVCSVTTRGEPVTVSWSQHFRISIPFVPDLSFDKDMKGVFRCE